jgi:hypothetical protein
MSVINTQPLIGSSGNQGGAYNLERSLRFRGAATASLSRTLTTPTSSTLWTWSGWVKRGNLATGQVLFGVGSAAGPLEFFSFSNTNILNYTCQNSGSTVVLTKQSSAVYRDPSAWYHVVVQKNASIVTGVNAINMYVNGQQITNWSTNTVTGSAASLTNQINTAISHSIGQWSTSNYFDGYMTEVNFIDGQALTPSSFGENDTITGVWKPKRYAGTYGTNGFYLPFTNTASTSTLGNDFSGNGNNWTVNNISLTAGATYDSMTDVPTLTSATAANYCVWNPIGAGGGSILHGNLRSSTSTTTATVGTMAMLAGKWYWEVTLTTSSNPRVGIYDIGSAAPADFGGNTSSWAIVNGPSRLLTNGSTTNYGSFNGSNGDIVMIAYDAGTGNLWFGANGSWIASGNPATATSPSITGLSGRTLVPAVSSGTGANLFDLNCGQQPFAYTPPTGFKALNTFNLPDSTIKAGNKVMDATLWAGNNASPRAITNTASFKPDLVWIKNRSGTTWNNLIDSVRGVNRDLFSNATNAEALNDTSGTVSAFNSSGFSVSAGSSDSSDVNATGSNYVGWQWQAGQGSTSSNTSGSITSTVSVNAAAGFSIVTYTGNGTSGATVGHGLGVAPKLIIGKKRSATGDWTVYHASLGNNLALFLNGIFATDAGAAYWNTTTPTSSVFTLGNQANLNASGATTVAYCWSEIEGFSQFGRYTGNGSTDGPFVYTGFRPKFILTKRSDSTSDWWIQDTTRSTRNAANALLFPNLANTEFTTAGVELDFLSNGFKIRNTNTSNNGSGATIIYACFAENPFKNSLAR